MIVRNESAILERCLRSVLPYLSCYVVCDTGSSDDTVALTQRVLGHLPGSVPNVPFENFSQARNAALDLARQSELEFDYLLLIDADMELVVADPSFPERLSHPGYLLRQVAGDLAYDNVRLLARHAAARYVGPTHEYLSLEGPLGRLTQVHMLDHACGSSRAEKLNRDLSLLQAALEQQPDDTRSWFYLAQTLREAGRFEEAISAYQRRIELGGWEEEVWYSRWMIARCRQAMGNLESFVSECLSAYQQRPTRAEPLHSLAQYYGQQRQYELSALFAEAGLSVPRPDDMLFVEEHVYRYSLRHELSISAYYCSSPLRKVQSRRLTEQLALERSVPSWTREVARRNWSYHARSLAELCPSARFVALDTALPEGFAPCNPSLAFYQGSLWCNLRLVNYRLAEGVYEVADGGPVRTINHLLQLDSRFQVESTVILEELHPRDECPEIYGLEDIRLIATPEALMGSATVVAPTEDYLRQIAVFTISEDGGIGPVTVQQYGSPRHQKNWMPFVDGEGVGFLYACDPITVLRWDPRSGQSALWRQQDVPYALDHQRGSSGAIPWDGGWLLVTHEVSYPAGQRTYLHRFLWLDANFSLRALSEAFTFCHLGIEFCCGLTAYPGPDQLLLSFGVEDHEAWLVAVSADQVRRALRRIA